MQQRILSLKSDPVHISGERQAMYASEVLEVTSNRRQPMGVMPFLKSWGQTGDLSRRWQIMEDNMYKAARPLGPAAGALHEPWAPVLPAFLPPVHLCEVSGV